MPKTFKAGINERRASVLETLIPTQVNHAEVQQAAERVKQKARDKAAELKRAAEQAKERGLYGAKGRPKRTDKDNASASSAEKGTRPGEARKTYLVNIATAEKLESIAYWERKTMREVIGEAMLQYLKAYEKKNGPVKKPNL